MTKDEILFERKRVIVEKIYEIIKEHLEFNISVTVNFEFPIKPIKAWFITQEKIISEAVDCKGISSINIEDISCLNWEDYVK